VLGQALVEALATLAEPGVAERILDSVLHTEQLDGFPEDIDQFRVLLEGPVYRTVWQWLGDDAATSLVEQLEPTLEMATSHLRSMRARRNSDVHARRDGSADEAPRPAAGVRADHDGADDEERDSDVYARSARPAPLPTVALLSFDEPIAAELMLALEGRARVRIVELTMELVAAIERGDQGMIVVVDDEATPIDAETVEWIGSLVDTQPPIVLWGVDSDRFNAIHLVAPSAKQWVRVERREPHSLAVALDAILATLEI
jgi:hypothetical protein